MRWSAPIPRRTLSMSAPSPSASSAISFMNEMRVASMALAAYLVSSALTTSIHTVRSWWRLYGMYRRVITCRARSPSGLSGTPMTMRSGRMKSSMAAPSFRNSGLETTTKSRPMTCLASSSARTVASTAAAVPTGTVDLLTTTVNACRCCPIWRATASTCCKSADPSSLGGVPTAMNTTSACCNASAVDCVNARRPACRLRLTMSSSPGS